MLKRSGKGVGLFIAGIVISLLSPVAFATTTPCNTAHPNNPIFNDAVQTNDPAGKIGIQCGSVITSSTTSLETSCLGPITSGCTPPSCSPKTCSSANCSRNTTIPQVGTMSATFPTFSGGSSVTNPRTLAPGTYNTVTLSSGTQTLNCTSCNNTGTDYKISNLVIGVNTVNLAPGNYYIKNLSFTGTATSARVFARSGTGDGSGTVRLFFNNGSTPVSFSSKIAIGSSSAPEQFLIYAFQGASITNVASDIYAILYSPLDVSVQPSASGALDFIGAIIAKNITLGTTTNQTVNMTYDSGLPSLAGFGPITCTAAPLAADHFDITGISTPASNCSCISVTVTARKSDNSIDTNYTKTVVLNTQGNCTPGSTCTNLCSESDCHEDCQGIWNTACGVGGSNNGYFEYTFKASDKGVKTFALNYPADGLTPTNLVVFQQDDKTINGSTAAITFSSMGQFLVIPSNVTPSGSAPAGYSASQVAGTNFSPQVKLVAYSVCSGGSVATTYTGNKSIRLYSTYVDPTPVNAAGANVVVNGTIIAKSSTATPTVQTLNFVNGVHTLSSVKYSDVGSITLTVSDNNVPNMDGISGNIVVKPYNFVISGSNIPGTNSPTGTIFGKAGQPFAATVTVKASDGAVTGSYGKENTPQGILLKSASLAAPAGGRNGSDNLGTIGNGKAFNNTSPGVFQGTTFTYDEVGSINLQASVADGDYLGAGNVLGTTALVGRFQPDRFDVTGNTPLFTTGCPAGQFTYLDKPFVYSTAPVLTVKAKAANNPISTNYTTQNYKSTFKKIGPSQFAASTQDYQPGNAGTPAIDKSTANLPLPTETDDSAGTLTYTFAASNGAANTGLKLNRPSAGAAPLAPFVADIELRLTVADTDTTPVTYGSNPFVFNGGGSGIGFTSGANFYQGRLLVKNAYGSEITSLDVPMEVQYYNGGQFVANTLDSCTSISNVAHILLTNPPAPQVAVTTAATLPQPNFVNGLSYIRLSAPNSTGQKNIEVDCRSTAANLPWLQHNWAFESGTGYENPHAQANFGTYKGEPNVIYQRENYP